MSVLSTISAGWAGLYSVRSTTYAIPLGLDQNCAANKMNGSRLPVNKNWTLSEVRPYMIPCKRTESLVTCNFSALHEAQEAMAFTRTLYIQFDSGFRDWGFMDYSRTTRIQLPPKNNRSCFATANGTNETKSTWDPVICVYLLHNCGKIPPSMGWFGSNFKDHTAPAANSYLHIYTSCVKLLACQ